MLVKVGLKPPGGRPRFRLHDLADQLRNIDSAIGGLSTGVSQLGRQLGEARLETSQLRSDVSVVETTLKALRSEVAQTKTGVAEARSEIGPLGRKSDRLAEALDEVRSVLGKSDDEIGRLHANIGALADDTRALRSAVSRIGDDTDQTRSDVAEIAVDAKQTRSDSDAASDRSRRIQSDIEQLNGDLERLRETIGQSDEAAAARDQSLEASVAALGERFSFHDERIAALAGTVDAACARLQGLEDALRPIQEMSLKQGELTELTTQEMRGTKERVARMDTDLVMLTDNSFRMERDLAALGDSADLIADRLGKLLLNFGRLRSDMGRSLSTEQEPRRDTDSSTGF